MCWEQGEATQQKKDYIRLMQISEMRPWASLSLPFENIRQQAHHSTNRGLKIIELR